MGFRVKINYQQLPMKMHYLFFMAAMGPILPFLSVYGKQLGVSSIAMGSSTAILPILYLIAKPMFGFLADYFRDFRKTIFLSILIGGSSAFTLLFFLPISPKMPKIDLNTTLFSHPSSFCNQVQWCQIENDTNKNCDEMNYQAEIICRWMSDDNIENSISVFVVLKNENKNGSMIPSCLIHNTKLEYPVATNKNNHSICDKNTISKYHNNISCKINNVHVVNDDYCLYRSYKFWIFILLMSIGSVSFNVTNSISDAICFDMLGKDGEMGYGRQRLWGTIGFGLAAFLSGYAIDSFSHDDINKTYTPAFILVMMFTCFDVICCQKLKLPNLSSSKTIFADVIKLIKNRTISIFLIFATIVGIIDSFFIYFLFWYLEDLAAQTNYTSQIKLIEGLTVAAETLGGEVIVFLFSGKILKKFGYGYSFSLCFVCYALRLILISIASNPWWVVLIELFMQGPTYALGYTIIVSMASKIAPPGTSATVQGIAAGMDDGYGFALGSMLGGVLYYKIGGVSTFRCFSLIALITSITYLILYIKVLKNELPETKSNKKIRKGDDNNIIGRSLEDYLQECETLETVDKNEVP